MRGHHAIISAPQQYNEEELLRRLHSVIGHSLYLKCEGFNFAGSIKLKAATEMVDAASATDAGPGSILVESPPETWRGAEHDRGEQGLRIRVRHRLPLQPDDQADDGGPGRPGAHHHRAGPHRRAARARINHVRALVASDPRYVWLNQYTNPNNWKSTTTAPLPPSRRVPEPGRAVRRRRHHRHPDGLRALVQAVPSLGTDRRGGHRRLGHLRWSGRAAHDPGLGTSVRPAHLDESYVDEVVLVEEPDTIRACHGLARKGFLFAAPPAPWSAGRRAGSTSTTWAP